MRIEVAGRGMRLLIVLAVCPALTLSPITAEAILIHDHLGHVLHSHHVELDELDTWKRHHDHDHAEHERDDGPSDIPEDGGDGALIVVLDLPDALPSVRGPSGRTVAFAAPSSSPTCIGSCEVASSCHASLHAGPSAPAPGPRAPRAVAAILRCNHALLL